MKRLEITAIILLILVALTAIGIIVINSDNILKILGRI